MTGYSNTKENGARRASTGVVDHRYTKNTKYFAKLEVWRAEKRIWSTSKEIFKTQKEADDRANAFLGN